MVLGEVATLRASDVAAAVGTDADYIRSVWRLLGFPDPGDRVVFLERDIPLFAVQFGAAQFFGHEPVEHMTRAFGAGARHMLEATIALAVEAFGNDGLSGEQSEFAWSLVHAVLAAAPALLAHSAQATADFAAAVPASGRTESQVAVAFCDLADSTRSSLALPVEMKRAITAFELHATHVVVDHGGRVVKFVGDEVLFVNPSEAEAVETAVELVNWVDAHDVLTSARAGVATGSVSVRDGDVYGSTVNLAARVTEHAPAGSVVVVDNNGVEEMLLRGFDTAVRVRSVVVAPNGDHGPEAIHR